MLLSTETWYEAIPKRHSVRSYTDDLVDPEILGRLARVAAEISTPAARVTIATGPVEMAFQGAVGSYGKVFQVPVFAAVVTDSSQPEFQEMCGYAGEAVVLEAVASGLATRWAAGLFQGASAAQVIPLEPDEDVLAIITMGYEALDHDFREKEPKKIHREHSRKSLDELTSGISRDGWPEWAAVALEAARLAPSAANRQPWRFEVAEDSITISVDEREDTHHVSRRLDCGIAMLHLETGARHAGIDGRWEYLEAPRVARFLGS